MSVTRAGCGRKASGSERPAASGPPRASYRDRVWRL